jgi:septin family protein
MSPEYKILFNSVLKELKQKTSGKLLEEYRRHTAEKRTSTMSDIKLLRYKLLQKYIVDDPNFIDKVDSLGFNLDKILNYQVDQSREVRPRARKVESYDELKALRNENAKKRYYKQKKILQLAPELN